MVWRRPRDRGIFGNLPPIFPFLSFRTPHMFFNSSPASELRIQIYFKITNPNSLKNMDVYEILIKNLEIHSIHEDENHVR